jgi:mannan polymerase II complex ANP1 subunit
MGFEVSGLPHYVIWHVYEPSEEDLVRMAEMEKENEVKQLDVEDVDISRARWENDRKEIELMMEKNKASAKEATDSKSAVIGSVEGPVAHVGEDGIATDQANGLTDIDKEKSGEHEKGKNK